MSNGHKKLETNIGLMAIFIVIAVSLGGLVEIVPLIFMDQVRQPAEGVVPYLLANTAVTAADCPMPMQEACTRSAELANLSLLTHLPATRKFLLFLGIRDLSGILATIFGFRNS